MSDTRDCPYCGTPCDADFCDVGVGMIQCGPYHCDQCGASEIGPYDNYIDPFRTAFHEQPNKPAEDPRILTKRESETGWYAPNSMPGSSANVIGGKVVSHRQMKAAYQKEFKGNPLWNDKSYVDDWYKKTLGEK